VRNGEVTLSESGRKLNEVFPYNYAQHSVIGKTRAEVKAELIEAVRNGEVILSESGRKLKEVYPYNYPA